MSTATTRPRAAQRKTTQPTMTGRNVTVTNPDVGEAICDLLDADDYDDEIRYLGNNHPPAMKAIADLDDAQRERTHQMIDLQRVYIQILDDMGVMVVDQNGRQHDLRAIQSTVMAFAWTMSLLGFRKSAQPWIKKRRWTDNHGIERLAWVDVRQPDDPADQLTPEHKADDRNLPPDLRSLAAQRDHLSPRLQGEWHVSVEPKIVDAPRPKDW